MSAPAVLLHVAPGAEWYAAVPLRELRAGLEEEGVPCRVVTATADAPSAAATAPAVAAPCAAAALAHAAAKTSPVGVGLGLDARHACLHLPQLAPEAPLVSLDLPHDAERLRALGHNAARLVKGAPLKELS